MTSEQLAALAGVLLSLAFFYIPGIRTWYEARDETQKSAVMAVAILAVALAVFALSCGAFIKVGITCDQNGLWQLATDYVAALVANQSTYTLARKFKAA